MNILLKPVITEKATADSELKNRFTFMVDTGANKVQIKNAVEAAYHRTDLLEQRRPMMDDWAKFIIS